MADDSRTSADQHASPPRGLLPLAGAIALFIVALIAVLVVGRAFRTSVEVPDVSNMSQAQAMSALKEAGLNGAEGSESLLTAYPPDWVVSQSPAPGTRVKAETTVTLSIANPAPDKPAPPPADAPEVAVPNVTGKPWTTATDELQKAGLQAYYVYSNSSPSVPMGNVIRQSPSGGAKAKKGATVTLTVSLSSEPNPELPNGELPPSASQ